MYNKEQKQAILADNNVVIVIAGAGSGKTTVLVERIKHLIVDQQKNIENILAITFTNKAAKEMKERLQESVDFNISKSNILTFHALAVKIIRQNVSELKYHNSNFIILDTEDRKKIIKNIIKNMEVEYKVPDVLWAIDNAKNQSLTYANVEMLVPLEYKEIYKKYSTYCQKNNAFDFDDLLLVCYHLLKIKDIRTYYQDKFKYIHVDEFQDTSIIQGEILKKIKADENTLFVVGDVDQSIYTWRGATIDNILNIINEYEDSITIKLEQNYRSTQNILNSANMLIKNNHQRIDKDLWTDNSPGEKIKYYQTNTNNEEAIKVMREIQNKADYGAGYNEFAVLYRYNYQSRKIEETFVKNRIPYNIYGGIRFYERMEIKDILAYLRLIINKNDNISLLRIINTPKRKVGDKTIEKYNKYAEENNISLFETIRQIGNKSLLKMVDTIDKYENLLKIYEVKEFSLQFNNFIAELNYEAYLHTQDEKSKVEERMQNIMELKEGLIEEIKLGNELNTYINELSLFKESTEEEMDAVVLSTIHGVKGLEFDNVYLIGMIEGKFPKENALYNEEEMEEERRLAYVAITRAKKNLTMLSSQYDFKYDLQEPSRFIEEAGINPEEYDDQFDGFIF